METTPKIIIRNMSRLTAPLAKVAALNVRVTNKLKPIFQDKTEKLEGHE